jgi:hypothetical protein
MPIIKARSSSIINSVDLRGTPTAPTANSGASTTQIASTAFVSTAVSDLINSAPSVLDTLAELSAAINNDESFASTVTGLIAEKVALSGDTMTGFLTLSADPTNSLHAATKQYVDDNINAITISSTDDVPEGSLNLYYTDARVRAGVSLTSDNTTVLDYDSATGAFTYNHPSSDGILEGQTNQYFSQSRARGSISLNSDDNQIISYSNSTGEITFTTPDTDKIVEGATNLYFTTARARNSVSAGSNISYDSSTGIISSTAAVDSVNGQTGAVVLDTDNINEGSSNLYFTNARAHSAISLTTDDSNILSYSSGTGAFTFTTPSTDAIDEGTSNLYYTNARVRAAVSGSGDISYDSATGNFSYSTPSTDGVNEGSSNLYFTNARARSAVSLTSSNTSVLSYDSSTGEFTFDLAAQTTDDVAEGQNNLYYTDSRARGAISTSGWGNLSYNSSTGVVSISAPSTDDVSEGTNLYFNDQRARNAVSATDAGGDGSFSYDNTTGVFTYTGPDATETRAHFSADNASGATYDSSTGTFGLSSVPNSSLSNSSITINGATIALGGSDTLDTDDISEGTTNLYYTDARSRSAISVAGGSGGGSASGKTFYGEESVDFSTSDNKITFGSPRSRGLSTAWSSFTAGSSVSFVINGTTYTSTLADPAVSGGFNFQTAMSDPYTLNLTSSGGASSGTVSYFTVSDSSGTALAGYKTGISTDTMNGPPKLSISIPISNANLAANISSIPVGATITAYDMMGNATVFELTSAFAESGSAQKATYTVVSGSGSNFNSFTVSTTAGSGSGGTSPLSYDSATGVFTFTASDIVESVNGQTGVVVLGTDDIDEGTNNLYYTTARTRADVSAGTGVTYNSSTGEFSIGQAVATTDDVTFADVTVTGDLTVQGTLTTINSTTVDIADLNLTVAKGAADAAAANGAGLTVDGAGATITYASGADTWNFNKSVIATSFGGDLTGNVTGDLTGNVTGNVTGDLTGNVTGTVSDISNHTTNALSEGSTNRYFTQARARQSLSATTSGSGYGDLSYDDTTGTFTFTKVALGDILSQLSVTDTGGDGELSYDSANGVFTFTGVSASETRAHFGSTSASGITYDSTTGTFALASIPNSSLSNSDITINGTTISLGGSDTLDTDDISEGSTNQYFTSTRARNAISLTTNDSNVLSYDSATGAFAFDLGEINTDGLTEGTTNLFFTTARARDSISVSGDLSYDSSTGVISYSTPTTDGVTEGTNNLYFTNARVRSAISLTTDNTDAMSYDSATGIFSFTLNSVDTDEIDEGATNLYFTTARARNTISAGSNISYDSSTGIISTTAAVESVNGQTGVVVLDTDDVSEGSSNLYFSDARARSAISLTSDDTDILDYNSGTGALTFVKPTTDAITEGTNNLYYTDARADGRIAAASVRDLSDVDSEETLQDGFTLVWSSSLQKFVPQNIAVTATNLNFTGDGTTTSYSTGVEVSSIDNTQVYINGLIQAPTYSYTLSTTSGVTSIVMTEAPEANDYIMIRVSSTSSLTAGGVLNENSVVDGGTF